MENYKKKLLEEYLDWKSVDTGLLIEATEEEAKEYTEAILPKSGYLHSGAKYYKKAFKNDDGLEEEYQAMMDRAILKMHAEIVKASADIHCIKGWVVHFAVNAVAVALLLLISQL